MSLPFLLGGTMKLITPYEALGAEPNMGWVAVRFVPRIGAGSTPGTGGSWSRGWGWAERREIIVIFKL